MKSAFNLVATSLGGFGTFLFGIGTITELFGATPGRNGYDADATLMAAGCLAISMILLATGIYGTRKAAAKDKTDNSKPKDPQP